MCKDKYAVVTEVGICEANKTSKYVEDRLLHWDTLDDGAEMLGTWRFSGTFAKNRSIHVWTLGLVFGRVRPAPTCNAKIYKNI